MDVDPSFEPESQVLTLAFIPDPGNPKEQLLTSCIYAVVMVYPNDPWVCFAFSLAIAKLLGFLPALPPDDAAAKAQLKADPALMAALPQPMQDLVNG